MIGLDTTGRTLAGARRRIVAVVLGFLLGGASGLLAGEFSLSPAVEVREGDAGSREVALRITRSSAEGTAVVALEWSGSATPGEGPGTPDYAPTVPSVRFEDGEDALEVVLRITGDREVEPDELVVVRLAGVTGIGTVTYQRRETTVRILNDDEPVVVSISPPQTVAEGDEGSTVVRFEVERSDARGALAVGLSYSGLAAYDQFFVADDYGPERPGELHWGEGQATAEVVLEIIGDREVEGDEALVIELETLMGSPAVVFGRQSSSVLILNDDQPVEYALAEPVVVFEGDSGVTVVDLQVRRSDPRGQSTVLLAYSGEAVFGEDAAVGDYGPLRPVIREFRDGQDVIDLRFTIFGDLRIEERESIELELVLPLQRGVTNVLGRKTSSIVIVDDDTTEHGREYRAWAAAAGLPTAEAALNGDPDGDGMTNWEEFVFGGSDPGRPGRPPISFETIGSSVHARFQVRVGVPHTLRRMSGAAFFFTEVPTQVDDPPPPGLKPGYHARLAILDPGAERTALFRLESGVFDP